MKKIISVVCIAFLLSAFLNLNSTAHAKETSFNWYCVRNKEHKQPTLDNEMKFIEEYDGIYVDKARADEKVIYLTFDVGYENGNVSKILDTLKKEKVKATFFILEHLIDAEPALVCRMANEGHTVCNHTSTHIDITAHNYEKIKKELLILEEKYTALTGKTMAKLFRPPEGRFNRESLATIQNLGFKTVFWSFAYADWNDKDQPTHAFAKQKILDNIHNGEIMLLHPTSKTNADILDDIIKTLKNDGYRFETVDKII